MDVGPIPWLACATWCDFHGFDRDATILIWGVLCHVESERAEREASRRRLKNMRGES